MSSTEDEDDSSSSSEQFQSAQLLPDRSHVFTDNVDSSDESCSEESAAIDDELTSENLVPMSRASDHDTSKAAGHQVCSHPIDESAPEQTPAPSRPNKYHGPPSTWRRWTAPERNLAASLTQLTSKDLSMHLYNACMLKKGTKSTDEHIKIDSPDNDDLDQGPRWKPPRVWTAWPLSPSKVPRKGHERNWEEEGLIERPVAAADSKSSQDLKDVLVSIVQRHARGRFMDRETEELSSESEASERESSVSKNPAKGGSDREDSDSEDSEGGDSGGEDSEKAGSDWEGLEKESPEGEASKADPPVKVAAQQPVIMTDDERASQILKAPIQAVLSNLDDLLRGLHHARNSYAAVAEPASDTQGQPSDRSRSRPRPKKHKLIPPTQQTDDAVVSTFPDETTVENDSQRITQPKFKKRSRSSRAPSTRKRRTPPGLRDWSDVLGVASLVGWDPNVIERAAARCTSLFGEGITFRTLSEGKLAFTEHSYLPEFPQPILELRDISVRTIHDHTSKQKLQMHGGVHIDGYLKPVEGKKSWKYSNCHSSNRSKSQKSKANSSPTRGTTSSDRRFSE